MKNLFILFIIQLLSFNIFAQSISLDPNSLQLPRLAVNPTCAVADKGKMIYNTTQEKILYCNGTTWIDPSTGGVSSDWATVGSNTYLSNLNGRVGIGTSSPTVSLDIQQGGASGIRVKSSSDYSEINIDGATQGNLRFSKNGVSNWSLNSSESNDFQIFQSGFGPRLFIQSTNGNVGIGTNTPNNPLNIVYSGGRGGLNVKSTNEWAAIDIDANSSDAALRFYKQGVQQWVVRSKLDNFQINENGTSRLFIENNTGKVGIGTESPVNRLDINGRARIRHNGETAGLWFSPSTNATGLADGAFIGMETNTSAGIFIGGAWRMRLSSTGNLTISGTLTESDQRLKKDIKKVENPLAKIEALSGYNYHWIATDRDPKLQAGVLAQEVEKVMPELVNEDSVGTKSVNYVGIIPYLIESVKELSKKNEMLEKEIKALKK